MATCVNLQKVCVQGGDCKDNDPRIIFDLRRVWDGGGGVDHRDCTHTKPFTHLRSEVQLPSAAIRDYGFSVSAGRTT